MHYNFWIQQFQWKISYKCVFSETVIYFSSSVLNLQLKYQFVHFQSFVSLFVTFLLGIKPNWNGTFTKLLQWILIEKLDVYGMAFIRLEAPGAMTNFC